MSDERSELFLSCDLVGSTAFKQNPEARWEESFLAFYRQFPEVLGEVAASAGVAFQLWKPIGDELAYRVRVEAEADVAKAVYAWIEAMTRYENEGLAKVPLGTKGGAFIGTFPGPDVEASVPRDPLAEKSGSGLVEINDEALARRDHERNVFDYFGPSFDTGFRVISQCNPRYFTLSVEVAFAMLRAGVNDEGHMARLVYRGEHELKGVWGGRSYPLFAIDRMHDDAVNAQIRKVQGNDEVSHEAWRKLCELCLKQDGWPSRLYLPKSELKFLRTKPPDALADLRNQNSMVGSEEKPSAREERKGSKLRADAPMPRPRLTRSPTLAAAVLGITEKEFNRLVRGSDPPPSSKARSPSTGQIVTMWDVRLLERWWAARKHKG